VRRDGAVYIISVAAELAGVHPQTLRVYERKGLVHPARTPGGTRRYSDRDVERVRLIQELTQREGVNLAGVLRILELTERLERAQQLLAEAERAAEFQREEARRAVSEALRRGRGELVLYRRAEMERHAAGSRHRGP
jgi:MerR family transcriptional regulator/heat shock protein HspR